MCSAGNDPSVCGSIYLFISWHSFTIPISSASEMPSMVDKPQQSASWYVMSLCTRVSYKQVYNSHNTKMKNVIRHSTTCLGQDIYVPKGVSHHCTYPSLMYRDHTYPWVVQSLDSALTVCSPDCKGMWTESGEAYD